MKTKIKKRSNRYDADRPRSSHGHKYSKHKKCISTMILICTKQELSNTGSSIHENVTQH